ncbi:G5 and 3D domain-containing protein [Aquibacillus sediminis]|uniref:G5 and 3D domain-containing protein n=1 Tax=Aquibacillus sediminis TaxID=2574734 RepID=UPI0011081E3A|nr:G5 and 3D domain-containing protein [Aquibacillus sediminis]
MTFKSKILPVLKHKLVIPTLSVIVLAVIISITTYQLTKAEVSVVADEEKTIVQTHADTVEEVLTELDIEVNEHDDLSHALDDSISSGMEINYKQANNVTVSRNGETKEYYTTKETVQQFLDEVDIQVTEHDDLSVDQDTAITAGLSINLDKAYQVDINDGGDVKTAWTTGGTVEDVLEEQEVSLGELDRIEPEQSEQVTEETSINITRVEKVTDIVEDTKSYSVVKKNDNSLAKGEEKVISSGQEGLVAKHYEVTLENGEEVNRELVNEEVKRESEQRVVAVGTKDVDYNVSRGDDGEEVKEYVMTATTYTEKCNGCSGVTYTGRDLRNDRDAKVVAVDPNVIPLGSRVWVEGYGYATAADIGGAIKGNKIDLFQHSSNYNGGYGHKKVKVKVFSN